MTHLKLRIPAIVAALAIAGASSLPAATIELQFTGLDLVYANGDLDPALEIHDATSPIGGTGVPAVADPLTNVSFFVDGTLVGSLTADVFADVFIDSVSNIPTGGGVVTSGGNNDTFGFDILTDTGLPAWGLALNIDEIQIFYSGSEITIAGAGLAASVPAQDLPFGLIIDENDPITIVFSSTNLGNVTNAGGFLTGFDASGTGSISGTLVPEPSSVALAGFGLVGLVAAWRKRSSTK